MFDTIAEKTDLEIVAKYFFINVLGGLLKVICSCAFCMFRTTEDNIEKVRSSLPGFGSFFQVEEFWWSKFDRQFYLHPFWKTFWMEGPSSSLSPTVLSPCETSSSVSNHNMEDESFWLCSDSRAGRLSFSNELPRLLFTDMDFLLLALPLSLNSSPIYFVSCFCFRCLFLLSTVVSLCCFWPLSSRMIWTTQDDANKRPDRKRVVCRKLVCIWWLYWWTRAPRLERGCICTKKHTWNKMRQGQQQEAADGGNISIFSIQMCQSVWASNEIFSPKTWPVFVPFPGWFERT